MINHDQAMYILYVLFINHYISTIFKLYTKMVVYFEALISLFAIVFFSKTKEMLLNLYIVEIIQDKFIPIKDQ